MSLCLKQDQIFDTGSEQISQVRFFPFPQKIGRNISCHCLTEVNVSRFMNFRYYYWNTIEVSYFYLLSLWWFLVLRVLFKKEPLLKCQHGSVEQGYQLICMFKLL